MPGLARKIAICAAVDGLIIQPLSSRGQKPFQPARIRYGDSFVAPASRGQLPDVSADDDLSFEAFGVIGLVTVTNITFLITITRRKQVAQIFGYPIYVATEVAVTPCSSKREAEVSVRKTSRYLQKRAHTPMSDDSGSSEDEIEAVAVPDEVDEAVPSEDDSGSGSRSSIAEDVLRRRGSYGRFAQRWFSRTGWTFEQRRMMGMSNAAASPPSPATVGSVQAPVKVVNDHDREQTPISALLPKLLRTIQVLFGSSRSFFFSYDVDITRNLAKEQDSIGGETPLYARVEPLFFWNRHLLRPFMEAGHDCLTLPIMQGFVGQRTFVADSQPPQKDEQATESLEMSTLSPSEVVAASEAVNEPKKSSEMRPSERQYLVTLISRRSTKRAGLRYLRRGVNEDGFTANTVETEQILSSPTWDSSRPVYSFVQIRGSIPLFFTQTAYSLKPAPVVQHSAEANYKACKKHFERLSKEYGALQIVNLVEKGGIEGPLGTQYKDSVERLNSEIDADSTILFEWFDFHTACRGMKFENVSHLLLRLKDKVESMGSTILQDGSVKEKQKGALRTNCMDCLDRTNVCQSSFAKHMLDMQMKEEGIDMSLQLDQETVWFNTLWADNGDAVSKQYASTAAMKGDYTRTKKRDYRGALNDLGLSLARLYSGMVNDYFSQAAIDFLLGNVTGKVFEEFESDMMTKDPAISVEKMRERAIGICQQRVVADVSEEVHGAWVLVSPSAANAVKSWPMEDAVLILTDAALYYCQFDWDLDKVSSFERVDLASVAHIKFGTYITSTVSPSHMDEMRNVGFVVSYQPGKADIRRTNTRTLSTTSDIEPVEAAKENKRAPSRSSGIAGFLSGKPKPPPTRKLAFKATYTDSSMTASSERPQQSEIQQVVSICAEIERLAWDRQLRKNGEERRSIIEKADIISLDEAKRNTGLLEQLGHSIKRLVWA